MEIPKIEYTDAGGLSVAYAVGGSGPHDIVYCSNWTSQGVPGEWRMYATTA